MWLLVAAGVLAAAAALGSDANNNVSLPGTDSQKASDVLAANFPKIQYGTNPIVLATKSGKLTDSKYQQAINDSVSSLQKSSYVNSVTSPLSTAGSSQLSKGQTIGYINLALNIGTGDLTEERAQSIIDRADPAKKAGLQVAAGASLGQAVSTPSSHRSDVIGLSVAVIVLLAAFGSVVAMGLPIVSALFGLAIGLGVITLLTHVADVPTTAPTVATMIGLAVGIDYALFIVTKHRTQVAEGLEIHESIAQSIATAGGAVLFAGGTVAISLLALWVADVPLVTALGWTSAIAVVLAILAALTLLPALFGLLGDRVMSLQLPWGAHQRGESPEAGVWGRIGVFVTGRPWPVMALVLVLLLTLAVPVLSLRLGQPDTGALPTDTQARQAYDNLDKGFGPGTNGPFLIAAELSKPAEPDTQLQQQTAQQQQQLQDSEQQQISQLEAQGTPPDQAQQEVQDNPQNQQQSAQLEQQAQFAQSPASDPRLTDFQKDLQDTKGVASVSAPQATSDGTAAVYTLIATTAPSDLATEDLVSRLRDQTIPGSTKDKDMTADVGGSTAGYVDLANKIGSRLLIVIVVVAALSFLVLLLGFRSLLLAGQAALLNLVSVAAAYGVLTLVFQDGHGATLIGLDGAIPVVSYVPLIMFAVLFGLSTDYQVFLLSQVLEHVHAGEGARATVVAGLGYAGRIILTAALVMVSVFASFVLNGDPTIKQFGVGLAVAVAIDAIVVLIFVPALLAVLGRRVLWIPGWLDRLLPHVNIEGARTPQPGAGEPAPGRVTGG